VSTQSGAEAVVSDLVVADLVNKEHLKSLDMHSPRVVQGPPIERDAAGIATFKWSYTEEDAIRFMNAERKPIY